MYFPFWKLQNWCKRSAEIQRHNYIVLPNSSIVYHRFMGQEIWCISFLKQGIARIFLVCEDVVNCAPMPSVSTSRSRSFLLSENSGNAANGHTV